MMGLQGSTAQTLLWLGHLVVLITRLLDRKQVLRSCSALRTLNLSGNAMGAEGVGRLAEELRDASSLPLLEHLNLSENRIGAGECHVSGSQHDPREAVR